MGGEWWDARMIGGKRVREQGSRAGGGRAWEMGWLDEGRWGEKRRKGKGNEEKQGEMWGGERRLRISWRKRKGEDVEWRLLKCLRNDMKIHISDGNLKIIRWWPQSSGKSDYSPGQREFSSLSPGVVMVKFPSHTSAVFSNRKTVMTQFYEFFAFSFLLYFIFI